MKKSKEKTPLYGKGPGDGPGEGLYAGNTQIDQSVPWPGRTWVTTTVHSEEGISCPCPSGCSDCVYRSPHVYNNTRMQFRPLYNGSDPVAIHKLVSGGGASGGGNQWGVYDGQTMLDGCPALSDLVCVTCDASEGYYPAVFAGAFTTEQGSAMRGSGFTCIYEERCATLSSACGINFTFIEFFTLMWYLFMGFLFLFGIFNYIRRWKYMLHTCDPCLHMEEDNPNYPPFVRPPQHDPGQFAWLKRAWYASDSDILRHVTPDELMMLRWFRLVYHWFFGGTIFSAPVLMILYYYQSRQAVEKHEERAALGMKRVTIATVKDPFVFWVVVLEMWLLSIWLVYLLGRETKAYTRLCWKLSPAKVGIKSHAIVVNDIPQITTDPVPEEVLKTMNQNDFFKAVSTAISQKTTTAAESSATVGTTGSGKLPTLSESESESEVAATGKKDSSRPISLSSLKIFGSDKLMETTEATNDAVKTWLHRNGSELKEFFNETDEENIRMARPCTSSEIKGAVKKKLEGVMGEGSVVQCMLARDTRQLDKVALDWQAKHDRYIQQLIRENHVRAAIKELESAEGEEMKNPAADDDGGESGGVTAEKGVFKKTLSSYSLAQKKLETYRKELAESEDTREKLREAVTTALSAFDAARAQYLNDLTPSPSALVVLSRQMDAVIASQCQLDTHFGRWHTEAAAGPNDLVWHNVALTTKQRFRKNMRARVLATVMVLFFMVPVNFLVWIISQVRESIVDFFGEGIFKLLVGIILTIFLVLGHILSLVLSRQYGYMSKSRMDVSGASIYFWLLVFNLFLGNLSDRPVWNDLLDWVHHPTMVLHTLINRAVETSTFFLQFCMLRVAQSCPLELIHPPFHLGFLVKTIVHRVRTHQMPSRKMVMNWSQPENTPLHRVPAQTMVVFFLGCMYCVMAPFFLPVCGVFFSIFYLFFKHNLCYHYMQPYSSGQTLWPWLVNKTFVCLVASQVVLILGLPTLATPSDRTEHLRLALLPLPFVSWVQLRRTLEILEHSKKVPVHKDFGSLEPDVDEKGVVGDTIKTITNVQAKVQERVGDAVEGININAQNLYGQIKGREATVSPHKERKKRENSNKRRSTLSATNSIKNLDVSRREAAMEVRQRIADGTWRNYQPINLWPKLQERAAASVIVKQWKAYKRKQNDAATANHNE